MSIFGQLFEETCPWRRGEKGSSRKEYGVQIKFLIKSKSPDYILNTNRKFAVKRERLKIQESGNGRIINEEI